MFSLVTSFNFFRYLLHTNSLFQDVIKINKLISSKIDAFIRLNTGLFWIHIFVTFKIKWGCLSFIHIVRLDFLIQKFHGAWEIACKICYKTRS